jgi:hypothetical protein
MHPDMALLEKGDGKIISHGLRKEARKQKEYRSKQSGNAKTRWHKQVTVMPPHNPPHNPPHMTSLCSPSPSPIPTLILREDKNKRTTTTHKFIKPKPEEVAEYAKSISFELSGQRFCDYYEANGWKVGRNPMKDWQAAVRTWKNKDADQGKPIPPGVNQARPTSAYALRQRLEILEEKLGHARNIGKPDEIKTLSAEIRETKDRILQATK